MHQYSLFMPTQHAYALELLYDKLQPGNNILDVGAGSGYLTACFARAVQQVDGGSSSSGLSSGIVVGIEHQQELVQLAAVNIRKDDPQLLDSGRIVLIGELHDISRL